MILSYLSCGKLCSESLDNVKFDKTADVLVIGLGASGIQAAIASAREGVRVIGLEREAGIGGMPINGGVVFFYYGERGGTYEDVEMCAHKIDDEQFLAKGMHIESRRAVLHGMLNRYGVECYTAVTVTGVYSEENRIFGVRIFDNGKTFTVSSKMLIDATSDGHIIRMCPGVVTHLGRVTDGKTVPFTNRTRGITISGKLSHYNGDDGYCDQYDPYSFSERVLAAHSAKQELLGNENLRVTAVSPTPGVREGIRYEGEEHLSYRDIIAGREPEKVLFYARSDLDKHGHDHAMDEDEYKKWWVISNLATVTVKIPVPLGAVVPKGMLGIASAGRCLSVDSYASSAVRMNTDMFRMGECVGIASAIVVKDDVRFVDIDYNKFIEITEKYGCRNGKCKDKFAFDHPSQKDIYKKVTFDLNEDEMLSALSSETPGVAIRSALISERDIESELAPYLEADNGVLKFNAAVALGIRGCDKGIDILRLAVRNRDLQQYQDCRRSNQYKSAIAISLLGELGYAEDIDLIRPILSEKETELPIYADIGSDGADGALARDGYYQILTHAIMTMITLTKKYGGKEIITKLLDDLAEENRREKIVNIISFGKPKSSLAVEVRDFIYNAKKMLSY